jgi:hypothetical protein
MNSMMRQGLFIMGVALLTGLACCTIAPKPVPTAKFANGWVLGVDKATGTVTITSDARAAYNALVPQYGWAFLPPLVVDAGVTVRAVKRTDGAAGYATVIELDKQHVEDFGMMLYFYDNPAERPVKKSP